ncbi:MULTISPECIES: hypothetical protein [unclassified Actinoplanes]|uniref:hypothetical protein n=1 Tax=unclassified Actinoplanes TaxID=2626549 RepID=UPI00031F5CB7|nr:MULTISPECIES: hypothetical protein [unclassified Actinoplanes]
MTVPAWPAEPSPVVRGDWRERLALATDLAMIGVVATVLALPLITAPAALAAGSVAVRARYRDGRIPPWRSLTAAYRRGVLPGMTALPAVALLALDLAAVRGGRVPGGTPLFAVTTVAAIWLTGVGTLTLAMLGRALPWREAARQAWNRPWCASALAVINLVAVFLALTVPATIPLVIGFHLFAAHMLADRLAPPLV